MAYRFPLVSSSALGPEEIEAAKAVLDSGRVTQGPKAREFEEEFARQMGGGEAVFVNSGSSANLLAMGLACETDKRQEIAVPAIGWPTTIWPIAQHGRTPLLVDVNPETLGAIKPDIAVHLMGNATPMTVMPAMEDCCEAMDAIAGNTTAGMTARFGTFSFYISHHITSIEGGMILCRDKGDADRLRQMRDHGMTRGLPPEKRAALEAENPGIDPRFLFTEVGYNLRGDDVRAAIGLVQFRKRIPWIARRREIARFLNESLDESIFQRIRWEPGAVPFAAPLITRGPHRATLLSWLDKHGIENRPLVAGNMALQPAMKKIKHRVVGDLPGANFLHTNGCYIGIHPDMLDSEVEELGEILGRFKP